MIRDTDLAIEVNLISKNLDIGPADIYETLKEPINEKIRRVGREEVGYFNLQHVNLTIKNVKTPIMTKTYNVSQRGIQEQLINSFTKDIEDKDKSKKIKKIHPNKINYKVPSIFEGKTVNLSLVDVNKIAEIIFNTIFKQYPGLKII